jgi:hypothetical protein
MRLEDVRRRLVDEELRDHRQARRGELLPAGSLSLFLGVLLWMESKPADDWAQGAWFLPDGWLYELLGYAGSVLAVRTTTVLAFAASAAWLARAVWDLSSGGVERRRLRIEAAHERLRRPTDPT